MLAKTTMRWLLLAHDSVVQESASVSLHVLRQIHCMLAFHGPFAGLAPGHNTAPTCTHWQPIKCRLQGGVLFLC